MLDSLPRRHPVKVNKLQEVCDPFQNTVWKDLKEPITHREIEDAVNKGSTVAPDPERYNETITCSRQTHIQRIAWLVLKGWDDPIHIDVGVPGFTTPSWIVADGNHRLAAAIFRKDDFINTLVSGSISELQRVLGIQ